MFDSKLKPAVEEMTRKTFTTRHLGQIAAVYPEAFTFNQEKLRNYGSTSKVDKYVDVYLQVHIIFIVINFLNITYTKNLKHQ